MATTPACSADQPAAPLRRLLHDRDDRPMTRLAAGRRRAPLRLGEPRRRDPRTAPVFPPVTGGLHRDEDHAMATKADADAVPTVRRRAPLRLAKSLLSDGAGSKCSRQSPAGSIAACQPRPEGHSAGRAPAVRRRAQLRPAAGHDGAVRGHVLPSDGGLNCGCSAHRWSVFMFGGAPAVRRRAPLRLEQVRHRAADRLVVFPLFTGGLHCGTRSRNSPCATATVLQPLRGGLHCGERL